MKTTLDIVDLAWDRANSSSLKDEITGDICKTVRPAGSKNEDIVFNSPSLNSEQLQEGLINMNIYVPNLEQNIEGVQDFTQPDYLRLQELAAMGVELFKEVYIEDYSFMVQQTVGPIADENNYHFVNIRIEFFSENL